MFEHHRQPLLPRTVFYTRLARCASVGTGIILVSLFIGMAGYHWLLRMAWLDAFANAAMILSGMGPLDPVDRGPARLFAGIYALYSGLALLTSTGIVFAPVVHRFLHKFHLEVSRKAASD